MKTEIYLTRAGTKFKFCFEPRRKVLERTFAILILEQPGYGSRDDSLTVTRRIREGENYLVDWTGPMPTFEDAKIVAACWADLPAVWCRKKEIVQQKKRRKTRRSTKSWGMF